MWKNYSFSMCIGEQAVDNGKILLNGKSIEQTPIHLRAKDGLGYLPQSRSLFSLSTYDNLLGLIQLHVRDTKKQKDETERLLEEFNLAHLRSLDASVLQEVKLKGCNLQD